jgi:hypothetical protein
VGLRRQTVFKFSEVHVSSLRATPWGNSSFRATAFQMAFLYSFYDATKMRLHRLWSELRATEAKPVNISVS